MSIRDISIDELAQIIRKVDGDHSLGAGALAEAILREIDARKIAKKGRPPTPQQMAVLKWLENYGNPASSESIPRNVAWYADDVMKRMVARGWLMHSRTHSGCFEITDAGKSMVIR